MALAAMASCSGLPFLSTQEQRRVEALKLALRRKLSGLNRGIFGVQTPKKLETEELIRQLESMNTFPEPTKNFDKLEGEWKLLYSTISILGSKRTKLGLRDFISLGEFLQIIDANEARNVIEFHVSGLNVLKGSLTIRASYQVASPTRVNIKYESSTIAPKQLMNLFQRNYDLLLSIFNPAGWLEITYIDENWRVSRDDKGNVFLVERVNDLFLPS